MNRTIIASAIILVGAALMGCSSSPHKASNPSTSYLVHYPSNAHLTWCRNAVGCFDSAAALCSVEDHTEWSEVSQHPASGPWHQVPETGMKFPAMIQDDSGWRMVFVCGN
jgi:hypothetical protein